MRLLAERRASASNARAWSLSISLDDARDLAKELHALVAVALGVREDLERDEELLPVAALLVDVLEDGGGLGPEVRVLEQRLERLARAVVLRVEEQDLAVVLERAGGVAECASRASCRAGT